MLSRTPMLIAASISALLGQKLLTGDPELSGTRGTPSLTGPIKPTQVWDGTWNREQESSGASPVLTMV